MPYQQLPITPYEPQQVDPIGLYSRLAAIKGAQQEQQLREQQVIGAGQENQIRADHIKNQQAIDSAYHDALTQDESGNVKVDSNKLWQALAASGHGSAVPGILKNIQDYQKSATDLQEAKGKVQAQAQEAMGFLGSAIQQAKYDPNLADMLIEQHLRSPNASPQEVQQLQQMRQAIQQNPELLKTLADSYVAQAPKQQEMQNARTVAGIRSNGVDKIEMNDWLSKNPGKTPADYQQFKVDQGVPQQELKAWLKANPGKNAADYEVTMKKVVPAFNFNLQKDANGQNEITIPDQNSGSILAQTGLSLPAFNVLTGNAGSLPRDKFTRGKAIKDAQDWANKNGVDVSTIASQYKSMNHVLEQNVERMNSTKIMENELEGTIQNLRQVANDKDLGKLRFGNVAKIWAGQEVNDDLAQQYAMHLNQLRTELAAYNGATQGRTGNNITVEDKHEAEQTIKAGISAGSLDGLEKAVKNSTAKMGTVMQNSVEAARKGVWDLFGVGGNFKSKALTAQPRSGHQVGDSVTIKGKQLKISKVYPDGSFDAQ